MSAADIRKKLGQLEKAISSDSPDATKLLVDVKIALTTLPGLQAGVTITEAHLPDIEVARDAYELAALLSVRDGDEAGFERHVAQVKTYAVDYGAVLGVSVRQNLIVGLNLVRLMAQNRIAEFHTELELIAPDAAARADPHIDYALRLEHYLMEGSYSKMRRECDTKCLPHPAFGPFVARLMDTVREEVAACCESAYDRLPVSAALKLLDLDSRDDLTDLCDVRQWTIHHDDDTITFEQVPTDGGKKALSAPNDMEQVPSEVLIKRSLLYAKELEQII